MKKKIDNEYSTSLISEVIFLREHGVKYAFVKTDDKGITIYKYKKTPILFDILYQFYGSEKYGSEKSKTEGV